MAEDRYLSNFQKLWNDLSVQPGKSILLLDARTFPEPFMEYLKASGIHYLDYGPALESASSPVTLIYDQHWNDFGRDLVARQIIQRIKHKGPKINCN